MEPLSIFLTTALGYILKSASETKTVNTSKEELLGGFWAWVRPLFIKDIPEIETKPDDIETQNKTTEKLIELIKDEKFMSELLKKVEDLQKAGIKEKNIFEGDLKRIKKIRIGDKEYNPNESYSRKNIFKGNVEDADEFTLGDG